MFPGKYHQNGGFSMAMLVSGRVDDVYLFIIFALKCVEFFLPETWCKTCYETWSSRRRGMIFVGSLGADFCSGCHWLVWIALVPPKKRTIFLDGWKWWKTQKVRIWSWLNSWMFFWRYQVWSGFFLDPEPTIWKRKNGAIPQVFI